MSLILNKYETTFRLALWALDEPLEFFENKSQLSANDKIYYKKITEYYTGVQKKLYLRL
jgi:hypothetical protein